jgi:predicted DNA-binding protein (MmcQ/YjbR family)
MNIEIFRDYCLSKKGVTEHFPFDEVTLVFKVMNKVFALTSIITFDSINLKCDPEKAVLLRERYSGIIPGYHMSKVHWNTVSTDGSVPEKLLFELINERYDLIVKKLTKKEKAELSLL